MRLLGGTYNKTKRSGIYTPDDNVYLGNTAFNLPYFFYSAKNKTLSESSLFTDFVINDENGKIFALSNNNDCIYQYTLPICDDVSFAYIVPTLPISLDTAPVSVFFKSDGTKAYILGDTNDRIYQYALSTPWSLVGATYENKFLSIASQETSARSMAFSADGSKVYVVGLNRIVYQYTLTTAWDISTASYSNKSFNAQAYDLTSITGLYFKSDGTKFYLISSSGQVIYQFTLITDWDISTAFCDLGASIVLADTTSNSISFKSDGTKLYALGAGGTITQYSLSTAWDVSTAISDSIFFVVSGASADTSPTGIFFKPDGTKLYVALDSNDRIKSFSLTTAWDISTANGQLNANPQDTVPTGMDFSLDGTKAYVVGQTNDTIYQYTLNTAWNPNTASYSGKSFSVTSQEATPSGIKFKDDGTKVYMVGHTSDNIRQYSLSTAWDISTASFDTKSLAVGTQDGVPNDLTFSSDGTKAYTLGDTNNTIYQYTLTTPWDVSTGSYASKSFLVGTQEGNPTGLAFGDNGTKCYVIGVGNDTIYQYGLTTAWDISTASYSSKFFSVTTFEANPQALQFKSDGTQVYVIGTTNRFVYSFTLGTAWDISTATTATYVSPEIYSIPSTLDVLTTGVAFSSDGTIMYTSGDTNDRVYQYKLSTAWDVRTAIPFRQTLAIGAQEATSQDLAFSSDGSKAYVSGSSTIFQYNLSSNWNISTGVYASKSFATSTQDTASRAITFKDDGTKVYMAGQTNDAIYQYTLTTAWDISTASYDTKSLSISAREGTVTGIFFKSDGTSVYVMGDTNDRIDEFTLSTAWDVSTGSYASRTFTVGNGEGTPSALFFKPDGSAFYVIGQTNKTIYQYSLATAWDISTATTTTKSYSVSTLETTPIGLFFKDDGTFAYVVGNTSDTIIQINLATAWDISTANLGFLSVATEDTITNDLCFNSTGTRLYIAGNTNDRIFQYNLSVPWNIGTATYSNNSISIAKEDANITTIFLGNNGTRLYMNGADRDRVYSYILSTPDELSSINPPRSLTLSDATPSDLWFNSSGSSFYISGDSNNVIQQYDLSTAWDVSSATYSNKSITVTTSTSSVTGLFLKSDESVVYVLGSSLYQFNINTTGNISTTRVNALSLTETTAQALVFGDSGTKVYILGQTNDIIYQYNMTTAWDINTASYSNKSFGISLLEGTSTGLTISSDGTKVYFVGNTNDRIYELQLTTAWDISTAYYRYSLNIASQETQGQAFVFGKNGERLYVIGLTNNTVYQYNLTTAYDIKTASYASKSISLSAWDTSSKGIYFSSDGKNLYVCGELNDRVYQHKLTTAWELDTAYTLFNKRISSISKEDSPQGVYIGDSGTKMYIIGDDSTAPLTSPYVYQYTLSTAYDVSTATYANKSLYFADGSASAILFNTTGTKIYIMGYSSDRIREYLLTTAWDVSTAVVPWKEKSISTQTTTAGDLVFGSNGTKLYILSTGGVIYQYACSTAYNSNTAAFEKSFTTTTYDTIPNGISFKDDGTKLYLIGQASDRLGEYYLTTAWDIATITLPWKSLLVSARDATAQDICFGDNGLKLYYLGSTNDTIYQYNLSTAYDISTATYATKSLSVATQEATPTGLAFSSDGTKCYIVGSISDNIRQYTLTTAWDISTGSYATKTLAIGTQEGTSGALAFSSDGTKAYIVGTTNDTIYQYTLTTAWDISTGSYASKSFGIGTQEATANGLAFKSDGTKVYVVGGTNDSIYQYSLSTAWDISTASYDSKSISVNFQDTAPVGLQFNSDGTKAYILGSTNTTVYQFDVATAWDISTTNIGFISVLGQDTTTQAISFKSDGSRIYVLGNTNDRVYEYNLSVNWQISTATYSRQSTILADSVATGLSFKDDGTKFYIVGQTNDRIYEYTMTTAWDVSATTLNSTSQYVGNLELASVGLTFNSSGTECYIVGTNVNTVYQFPVETAWDIKTINVGFLSVAGQDGIMRGMTFSSDGTKIFTVGSSSVTKYIYQYNLDKAYLLSSGNYSKLSNLSIADGTPEGVTINSDGSKIYYIGSGSDQIYEYTLSTANDVGTITLNKTISIGYLSVDPRDLMFNNDGTILYMLTASFVWALPLDTAYDLQTTLANPLFIGTQDALATEVTFSSDGTKAYILGDTNNTIYQYTLTVPWLTSSGTYASKSLAVGTQDALPNGFEFGDSGTKGYMIGQTNNTIYQYTFTTAWDISTGSYASKSLPLSVYDTAYTALRFNATGTKVYVLGATLDRILEIELTTAWDISTGLNGYISVATTDTDVTGLTINNIGTKLYVIGTQNSKISQYDLSIPWAINSATLNTTDFINITTAGVGISDTSIQSVNFNERGTRLYIYGGTANKLYQFNIAFT
jgi:DNA-binding beta-propeller fold protein YncE